VVVPFCGFVLRGKDGVSGDFCGCFDAFFMDNRIPEKVFLLVFFPCSVVGRISPAGAVPFVWYFVVCCAFPVRANPDNKN
jgi:hypothetical protein